MQELISVIVPVYNVKPYLEKCVNSLLKQSYSNYEILLVDDGSTDDAGILCDKFAETSKKVTVIHKKNGGLSDARNVGIGHAKGMYVVFVDGDDFVSEHYLKTLINIVKENDAEIGICDIAHYYVDKNNKSAFKESAETRVFNSDEAIECMLYQKDFLVTACAKIFPRKFFDDILFPVGMLFEDSAIMYKLFNKATRVAYNYSQIYAYVHRDDSITTKRFTQRDLDILKICHQMSEDLKCKGKNVNKAMISYYSSACLRVLLNAPDEIEFDEAKEKCKRYLRKNGKIVLLDKNARNKNKYAITLFLVCSPLLKTSYKYVDRWK